MKKEWCVEISQNGWEYSGYAFITAEKCVRLDDYSLVNLAASYKLNEQVTLFGRVQNLTDADYEEIFNYNTAPVAAYAGMKVSFGAEASLDGVAK